MQMAEIGATREGGSHRLALTDEDNAALELFEGWARAEGCRVSRDRMGNCFAERPGIDASRPPVLVGSHLDTQPDGGRFDGPLGTLAALEIVRTLNEHKMRTSAPIIAVSWANEEGARFPLPCTGSSVFAGTLDFEQATELHACDGPTFADELKRLGRAGTEAMEKRGFAAYFELHIEQGPVLESAGKVIGVVSRDTVLAGAVYCPAVDEIVVAAVGEGCWWNDARCRVSEHTEIAGSTLLTTDIRFVGYPDRAARWTSLANEAAVARTWGDCYGYLLVATGRAELMVDNLMSPWDSAALIPVVREAGGEFSDWDGRITPFGSGAMASNGAMAARLRTRLGVPWPPSTHPSDVAERRASLT